MLRLTLALGLGLGTPISAQEVGLPFPYDLGLDDFGQTEAESLEDYVGRALLIEFFHHNSTLCAQQVELLNKLQREFGAQGLSVLSVTQQPVSPTENWIRANDHEPAYAFDKKGKFARYFGLRLVPDSILVDGLGTIVYRGHPGQITRAHVERALLGAIEKPRWEWPKEAAKLDKSLFDGRYADALAESEELGLEYEAIVRARLEAVVTAAEAAYEEGDILGALRIAEGARKGLNGLPHAEDIELVLEEIEADEDAQHILEGQEKLHRLIEKSVGVASRGKIDKLVEDVEELMEDYEGTIVAIRGEVLVKRLIGRRP